MTNFKFWAPNNRTTEATVVKFCTHVASSLWMTILLVCVVGFTWPL